MKKYWGDFVFTLKLKFYCQEKLYLFAEYLNVESSEWKLITFSFYLFSKAFFLLKLGSDNHITQRLWGKAPSLQWPISRNQHAYTLIWTFWICFHQSYSPTARIRDSSAGTKFLTSLPNPIDIHSSCYHLNFPIN